MSQKTNKNFKLLKSVSLASKIVVIVQAMPKKTSFFSSCKTIPHLEMPLKKKGWWLQDNLWRTEIVHVVDLVMKKKRNKKLGKLTTPGFLLRRLNKLMFNLTNHCLIESLEISLNVVWSFNH